MFILTPWHCYYSEPKKIFGHLCSQYRALTMRLPICVDLWKVSALGAKGDLRKSKGARQCRIPNRFAFKGFSKMKSI
ncbi:hypothetical protein HCUR_01184 [Holospora curviuscula]|uniref:Uncharacterized protein n=1 Tax=Holospora curviuscula TaxID=1082868 RepID=A0A2S5R7T3_9PROT|nr:hypothetical protein HCUR_01184 [Holospora curviuscula]